MPSDDKDCTLLPDISTHTPGKIDTILQAACQPGKVSDAEAELAKLIQQASRSRSCGFGG